MKEVEDEDEVAVGTLGGAYSRQNGLILTLVATLGLGIWLHSFGWLGVSNWLGRSGLVLIGISLSADFIDKGFGTFSGVRAVHMWQNNGASIRKRHSLIVALGAIGGTLVSAFADLWIPGV